MDPSRPRDPWWLAAAEDEVVEKAARASGPGGQHVNKTSTAIELRFDVRGSPSLPDEVKARLETLAGARLTQEGVLVLFAQEHRSQEMNRLAARRRLADLLRLAAVRPKTRRATRPTAAARAERLQRKARRAAVKGLRSRPPAED